MRKNDKPLRTATMRKRQVVWWNIEGDAFDCAGAWFAVYVGGGELRHVS